MFSPKSPFALFVGDICIRSIPFSGPNIGIKLLNLEFLEFRTNQSFFALHSHVQRINFKIVQLQIKFIGAIRNDAYIEMFVKKFAKKKIIFFQTFVPS